MNAPLTHKTQRVLVGTVETSGFVPDLADGIARLGHEVNTVMCVGNENFPAHRYDLDVGEEVFDVSWPALFEEVSALERPPPRPRPDAPGHERLRWAVAHHDVFVFVYASLWHDRRGSASQYGAGREYAWLKRLGKRVVSFFVGPEARHAAAYDQQMALLGGDYRAMSREVKSWGGVPVSRMMRNVRRAELYSDAILSQPNQAGLALRPYTHLSMPIDLSGFRPEVPGREVPVVVHAPSYRNIKGTEAILAALDALRADGVRFELRLLDGVDNAQVRAALREADVVIDQLHLPLHGRLGVEAMASGCALVTCDRADFEPYPPARPIAHIDPACLRDTLRRVLTDRATRVSLADAALDYVRRHHDHVAAAARIFQALDGAPPDHRPRFFAQHFRMPEGERLPRAQLRMSDTVAMRHGLPRDADVDDMIARGLLSPSMRRKAVPRWG